MSISHQSGVERIDIAYDDGVTWQKRPVKDLGDGDFCAILDSPDPDDTETGLASVEVEAWAAMASTSNRLPREGHHVIAAGLPDTLPRPLDLHEMPPAATV